MSSKLQITMTIADAETKQEKSVTVERDNLPSILEIIKLGFPVAFETFETATLLCSNEAIIKFMEMLFATVSLGLAEKTQSELCFEGENVRIEPTVYGVEAEIGQLNINAHILKIGAKSIFNTACDFFAPVGPRERWLSPRFRELECMFSTQLSMRETASMINRIRNAGDLFKYRNVDNHVEREGKAMSAAISRLSEDALARVGFDDKSSNSQIKEAKWTSSEMDEVANAASQLGISNFDAADYETNAIAVSVDEVMVKGQKEKRPMPDGKEKAKRIATTVSHIETADGSYTVTGEAIEPTLRLTAGFLVQNNLLSGQSIVFYSDGARSIHDKIGQVFPNKNYKIILDWYHLHKKVKEFGSMIFKGVTFRNEFVNNISPVLWRGEVDKAITLLENLDKSTVKNTDGIEQLIAYFNRVRSCIPCYALRNKLGLKTSSNSVEKKNDTLVAGRQKHNGMSWSRQGSSSLATITCFRANGELRNWIFNKTIDFKLKPAPLQKAA
jgi:uncharacterized protein with FMN-binding domain